MFSQLSQVFVSLDLQAATVMSMHIVSDGRYSKLKDGESDIAYRSNFDTPYASDK
jgi:hypothetical protein